MDDTQKQTQEEQTTPEEVTTPQEAPEAPQAPQEEVTAPIPKVEEAAPTEEVSAPESAPAAETEAPKEEAKETAEETPKEAEAPTETEEQPAKEEIAADDPTAAGKWYVVHTYSGHENKVATNLKQRIETQKLAHKIFDIVVPTRNVVTVKHGKKEEVKEKIFPGYILVKMILDDDTWLAVRTTQGVTAFVGAGNKPTPISEKEVGTILKFMQMEAPKYKTSFSKGEAVKVVDGPFADFTGTIDSMDEEKGKVKVLISIFRRETLVELDFLQIAKL
jgi:transcriptional antiterminator NusG